MFSDPRTLVGALFAGIGTIFLLVGLFIIRDSFNTGYRIDHVETLPLLNVAQLTSTPPGTEAVIEGKIAERNLLHINGFVAYISYEYQGERCTQDDDGHQDCKDIWTETEYLSPLLWLDLPDGRARVLDTEYRIENAPVTWRSTETLVEYKTLSYEGFKIGNPIFVGGDVPARAEGPAFNADFIYGGDRKTYLINQRGEATSLFVMGLVFSSVGGLFVIVGGVLLGFVVFG